MGKNTVTLDYYDTNAEEFAAWTAKVNFRKIQDKFLVLLDPGSKVLDFGCGSGRDAKYFAKQGFDVTATDGSAKMVEIASKHSGLNVQHRLFSELTEKDTYDAIWACASILHLSSEDLIPVLKSMAAAIHRDGLIYTSFKYGSFEGDREGRYYTDMTVGGFKKLIENVPELEIEEAWTTSDARPDRNDEIWLNLFLKRKDADKTVRDLV